MSWTLTTSGAAIFKAGADANTEATISGSMAIWSDAAEGRIVSETGVDWVGSYTNVNSEVKKLLSDVASSLIAKNIIAYDISGYSRVAEAQTMISMQDDIARDGIRILKELKNNELESI